MTTGRIPDIWREDRQERFARVGMGVAPDAIQPPGASFPQPLDATSRTQNLTCVVTLLHEGVPDGVLWKAFQGSSNCLAVGFEAGNLWVFRRAGGGTNIALIEPAGTSPHSQTGGIHTYVWAYEVDNPSGEIHAYGWVDGIPFANNGLSNALTNPWANGDWHLGVDPGVNTAFTPVGDLTNAAIVGDLQAFINEKPVLLL